MLKSIKFFFQLDHATARTLHGSPGPSSTLFVERLSSGNAGDNDAWDGPGLDELQVSFFLFKNEFHLLNLVFFQLQLARTRSKQEEDVLPLFKRHDDVDLRAEYARLVEQDKQKDNQIHSLEQQLAKALQRSTTGGQSPMPPRNGDVTTRLPKYK